MNDERAFLRHTVATVAYRAAKAIRDAPADFAQFKPSATTRTPLQILAHMGDLYDWALSLANGTRVWNEASPADWEDEVARFVSAVEAFDAFLASDASIACEATRLFSGPIADSLSHTGQIAMLRRMFGAPILGENYFKAEIVIGRVGSEQATPKREFD